MRTELLALPTLMLLLSAAGLGAQALDSLGDPLPEGAIQRLGTLRLRYGGVGGLAYLPDGRALVLTGGYLDIWDMSAGECLSHTQVSEAAIIGGQMRSDGHTLLLGDSTGRIIEWDVARQAQARSLETGQSGVRSVCYSLDEKRVLIAGGGPPWIQEWDLDSGEKLIEIRSEMATTRCGAIYGPEGKTAILGGGYDHILEHWDLTSGKLLQKWYKVYETKDLALSPDGKYVTAGVETHAAEWSLDDYEMLHKYAHAPADGGRVFSVAYLPTTNEVLCGARDGSIYRWNRDTGEQALRWTPHQSAVTHLAVSPDEQWVLSFGSRQVAETNIRTGQSRLEWDRHHGPVEAVAFLPYGQKVVSGSADQTLRVWDLASGRTELLIPGATLGAYALAVSPDGQEVAAGCKDSVVRVFSLADGTLLRELDGHLGYVRAVAYSHDGNRLLSSADDGSVCVWDRAADAPIARLEGHRGGVLALAIAADDELVVSGGRDGTVRLWDLEEGKLLRTFEGHRGWVEAVAFVGKGHEVISTGRDGRVLRWNLDSGEPVAEMAHPGWGYALACSPDGTRAYSAGENRGVVCWDVASGEKLAELKGHQRAVAAVAVSPDGSLVVTASRDNTLLVWEAPQG